MSSVQPEPGKHLVLHGKRLLNVHNLGPVPKEFEMQEG